MRNAKAPIAIVLAMTLFLGAATAAGISRGEEMNANGALTVQPASPAITGPR